MSLFVAPKPFGRNKARPLVGIADCEGLVMATSSKHDHKNVGCHRISPPPRSGDRVLATIRTPAEIYKHRKEKAQPDGAGAKFVVSEAPSFFTRPFSSNAQRVRFLSGVAANAWSVK